MSCHVLFNKKRHLGFPILILVNVAVSIHVVILCVCKIQNRNLGKRQMEFFVFEFCSSIKKLIQQGLVLNFDWHLF